jgi:NhaA family Na+:H+ antiporter
MSAKSQVALRSPYAGVIASLEKAMLNTMTEPFQRFIYAQSTSGVLLLAATIVAMLWANSPWAES